ncbi:MAG: alpha/beta hydrolase [Gammaproteobacteria bacterium]|nr:alpha/beta hydrolase [Gammaproteobacteria bacterium]
MRLILFLSILLLSACTQVIFHPVKKHFTIPKEFGITYHDYYFTSYDGLTLHGWYLPTQRERYGTVLFFHGNAQNISTHVGGVYWLTDYGYDVYIIDYRGYGKSDGIATLPGAIADIRKSIEDVVKKIPDTEQLIVMGQSLGASMSTQAVVNSQQQNRIKALILVSAFSDYQSIAREFLDKHWLTWALQWPLSFTINNDYRPLNVIGLISPIPILIMHSKNDEMISYQHAELLFSYANEPKQLIDLDGGHNDWSHYETNRKKLIQYLTELNQP